MKRDGRRSLAARGALLVLAATALVVAGCALGAPAPGVAGFAKGVITAKGSIFVNGVEYDTTGASVTMDGTTGHPATDLKVGMEVELKGTIDNAAGKGVATEIQYNADLEGPIDTGSINGAAQTFTVFGQAVQAQPTTVYEGVSGFSGLVQGDRVEVSGTADASTHAIMAARIEVKTSTGPFELKGIVSSLATGTFVLTPRHAAAGITVNFTGTLDPGIVNGSFVEVKFSSFSNPIATTASQILLIKELEASEKDMVEVGGVVSNFVSGAGSSTFTVDGISVSADNSLLSGVSNGVEVEVRGTMSSGVLVASAVHVEQDSNILLGGTVSAVDTMAGTITVNGVTLATNGSTIFRDLTTLQETTFNLGSIKAGDYVGASGYTDASVSPAAGVATRVEKLPTLTSALLAGPVSAATTTSLTILGVSVDISSATLRNASEQVVTPASTWVALITPGTTIVGALGTWNGSAFTASVAQIGEGEN